MRLVSTLWAIVLVVAVGAGLSPVFDSSSKNQRKSFPNSPAENRKEETEHNAGPLEAAEWRSLAWKDNRGYIDPDGLRRAAQQRDAVAKYSEFRMHDRTGSFGVSWQNPGPTNISGRCRAMLFDSTNPKWILEGTAGGGLWRSLDGGASFSAVNDLLPNLSIGCLVRDPNQNKTIYAGTGEGFRNIDALRGAGIYKSTDNGSTWSVLPGSTDFIGVNRIAIAPGNSKNILVGVRKGLFLSTDGGTTFKLVNDTDLCPFVAFNPNDRTKAVATAYGTNGYTAIYSRDGGQTWKPCTGLVNVLVSGSALLGRIELAYAPSNPAIVYATGPVDGSIYKSTDGGVSYAKVTTQGAIQFNGQQWYDNCLWVSPKNPNLIAAAGVNVWRSVDGGVTLVDIGDAYNGRGFQPHPDIHGLFSDPTFDGTVDKALYVCCDGGTFKTNDIFQATAFPADGVTTGWTKFDRAVSTQFYGVAGEAKSGYIIGGTQDNGTEQIIGTNGNASYIYGGDGGYVDIDPVNPLYQYGEYVDLQLFRTTDGGRNSSDISGAIPDAGKDANFIAPFVLDPKDPNRLWAGGGQLWLSSNIKSASQPTFKSVRPRGSAVISAIAVNPSNPGIVWVGQNDGVIQKSSNALTSLPTWTTVQNLSGGTNLFGRMITRILFDYSDPSGKTVFVALGGFGALSAGYGAHNFWKTTDGGLTWKDITGTGPSGLPLVPIRGIAQDPGNAQNIFVGTEVGVFWSMDGGATWLTSNIAPSNVSVDELQFMKNSRVLLAATHGRGLWIGTITNSGLYISPSTIYSGDSTTGTVTLAAPAPPGGVKVTLISDSPKLSVPSSVVVPAGNLGISFVAKAGVTSASVTATVTATLGTNRTKAVVTIQPGGLSGFTLSPNLVVGGATTPVMATVTLDGAATSGGATVLIQSSDSTISLPSTLSVSAGNTSATLTIPHRAVDYPRTVNITATRGTTSKVVTLTLLPAPITSFTTSTSQVVAGNTFTGMVQVGTPIPTGGQPVGMTQTLNPPTGTTPTTIDLPFEPTIPGTARSAVFTFGTEPVSASVSEFLSVTTGNNAFVSVPISIVPATITNLSASPVTLKGGGTTVITVSLNGAAFSGYRLNLTSDSKAAVVPSTVTVGFKQTSATIKVVTQKVTVDTPVTITVGDGTTTKSIKLDVTP